MREYFETLVRQGVSGRASDIHLSAGNPPAYRIDGVVEPVSGEPVLTHEAVEQMMAECMPKDKYEEYRKTGDADCALQIEGCGRFRVNLFRQIRGACIVMRIVNEAIPKMEDLGLPSSLQRILDLKDGLVLVTGPTGSGKSTTLAAIIHELNKSRSSHIITIEDPVEYVHQPIRCLVNQREVGSDSVSYEKALRATLREDPDIILVGEMRDLESMRAAITAAETGHLVFSTLHTIGAANTIDRLLDVFPPEQQQQIRMQLSTALKAVISQRLLPRAGGKGRIGAFEVMFVNSAISNLIRENKVANINQMIETGRNDGMITLDKYIAELLQAGSITPETAQEYSPIPLKSHPQPGGGTSRRYDF